MIFYISNIPKLYSTADLRNYFAGFIELEYFQCFHYRHRLDKTAEDVSATVCPEIGSSSKENYCSCLVKVEASQARTFLSSYHDKCWINAKGVELEDQCIIKGVTVAGDEQQNGLLTGLEKISYLNVSAKVYDHPEFKPPKEMPRGNVGTSTKTFLDLISKCQLQPNVIRRLGLQFAKHRSKRKYANVPFDYGPFSLARPSRWEEGSRVCTRNGIELSAKYLGRKPLQQKKEESPERPYVDHPEESGSEDDDRGEEWDRHEAVTDDVTAQGRTKERVFEEEMEVVWEKGGSGLVFYTDAQHWAEKESDFDEQTADDFNVDMSVYYHEEGGDKDARDYLDMRRSEMLREGRDPSELTHKKFRSCPTDSGTPSMSMHTPGNVSPTKSSTGNSSKSFPAQGPIIPGCSTHSAAGLTKTQIKKLKKAARGGDSEIFEDRVLSRARRIMHGQGWKQGKPLGNPRQEGIINPIESDGQGPRDRLGFGYHGEALARNPARVKEDLTVNEEKLIRITTVYDQQSLTDPPERLDRAGPPTMLKYR